MNAATRKQVQDPSFDRRILGERCTLLGGGKEYNLEGEEGFNRLNGEEVSGLKAGSLTFPGASEGLLARAKAEVGALILDFLAEEEEAGAFPFFLSD